MTELKVTLPDRLAREAREAGLLKPKAIKALLREAMRRRVAAREFLAVADRVAAAGVPAMSEDEIQAEIDAVRKVKASEKSVSALLAEYEGLVQLVEVVDALGNLLRFRLTGGQVADIKEAEALIEGFETQAVIGDKGYALRLNASVVRADCSRRGDLQRLNHLDAVRIAREQGVIRQ